MIKRFKNLTTTKKIVVFLFCNVVIIELVAIFATIYTTVASNEMSAAPDYTPLTTLIEAAITQVVAFAVYSVKSSMEKASLNKHGLRITEDNEVVRIDSDIESEIVSEDDEVDESEE